MLVDWRQDYDAVLVEAKAKNRPVLLDFNAAPSCLGSARLDAESYMDDEVSAYICGHFIPLRITLKQHPFECDHFHVLWTPTILILDAVGEERFRIEGYLSKDEFSAHLVLGLARTEFMEKRWQEATDFYVRILDKYPNTKAVAEALYWSTVCCYKQTDDLRLLLERSDFDTRHRETIWAVKASVWKQKRVDVLVR